MPPLELLANLGLPSAFVAMVLIAFIFKKTHSEISAWAAWIAVGLVAVYGVIQLTEAMLGSDTTVTIKPQDARAVSVLGAPVDLEISVSRGGKPLARRTVSGQDATIFGRRPLTLEASPTNPKLAVKYQNYRIGLVDFAQLRAIGWEKASSREPGDAQASFWSTHRVHSGQSYRLGVTEFGELRIRAGQFKASGEAEVTLELAGQGNPTPKLLKINNKQLKVQSFPEVPEFYVAVREADFIAEDAWVAFNVFSLQ